MTLNSPKFIVLGAHKAGTTSIHYYLKQHPEIFLPDLKGSDLLARRAMHQVSEITEYLDQFAAAQPNQILGEVSSAYLHRGHDKQVAEKIQRICPDAILIAVLRNPIDRAFSHALWDRSYTRSELNNFDALVMRSPHLLLPGLYSTHIQHYQRVFGANRLHCFLYDDLKRDAAKFIRSLYQLIGVDSSFQPNTVHRYHAGEVKLNNLNRTLLEQGYSANKTLKSLIPSPIRVAIRNVLSTGARHDKPSMSAQLKAQLTDYYADEIERLQQLTGLNCSRWIDADRVGSTRDNRITVVQR